MTTKIDFAAGAATATAIISATAPHAAKTVVLNVSGNVLTGVGLVTAPVIAVAAVATAGIITGAVTRPTPVRTLPDTFNTTVLAA